MDSTNNINQMHVIDISDLTYRWPGQREDTLSIERLQLRQGEHVFIRGASGSGKTTLLNLLAGILTANHGSINILGQDLTTLRPGQRDRFRADHVGIIFQQFNLLPYLSILNNVTLPCDFSQLRREKAGNPEESAKTLLQHLGLTNELAQKSVTELSVGQQQRVAVARALIGKPELIIADEPTSALDTDTRNDFLDLLFAEAEAQQSTILFVSHDPYIAERFPRVIDLHSINRATGAIP